MPATLLPRHSVLAVAAALSDESRVISVGRLCDGQAETGLRPDAGGMRTLRRLAPTTFTLLSLLACSIFRRCNGHSSLERSASIISSH